ncbi:MAG: RNA polymerase sigma factor [Clostridia bacterium]|nr:RNA polymerase sigma factor [Clostridia bacterium]
MEEDKYLYDSFLKGDMDSFKCLVLKYKNNLIYFLLKYVKDMQIAEDISQDVFLYILVNKKKYNFKYSFKTYLFLIGKSRALNYIKREKKKQEIIENMPIDVEPSLESYIFKNENSRELLEELKNLKPDYRDVIYLTNFERLSYKETGKILDKNEKQIKTLLYNAKQTLKNNLERKGFRYEE